MQFLIISLMAAGVFYSIVGILDYRRSLKQLEMKRKWINMLINEGYVDMSTKKTKLYHYK